MYEHIQFKLHHNTYLRHKGVSINDILMCVCACVCVVCVFVRFVNFGVKIICGTIVFNWPNN